MKFKIHPTTASAALKQHRDREYRVWVLARSLDSHGSGYALISDLQELIRGEGIRGLSPRTLKKLLKKGEGSFWSVYNNRMYYKGMYAVCCELDIDRLVHSPVELDYEWAKTLKKFRAACYSSRFPAGDQHSAPISRKTLKKINGYSPRTQRNYDKTSNVERRGNLKATGLPWKKGDTNIPEGHTVDYVGQELQLFQYMPNSYRAPLMKKAPRGMMRKINQRLTAYLLCNGEEYFKHEKSYFASPKRARKRIQSAEKGDFFYIMQSNVSWPDEPGEPTITRRTSRGGQVIWSEVQVFDGERIIFS